MRVTPGIFSPSNRVGMVSTSVLTRRPRFERLYDLGVDHLAGDVEKRRDIDAVGGFEHAHAGRRLAGPCPRTQ